MNLRFQTDSTDVGPSGEGAAGSSGVQASDAVMRNAEQLDELILGLTDEERDTFFSKSEVAPSAGATLDDKARDELQQIASAVGLTGVSRLKKAERRGTTARRKATKKVEKTYNRFEKKLVKRTESTRSFIDPGHKTGTKGNRYSEAREAMTSATSGE